MRARLLYSSTRPSRLQTTTLCVSSLISAAKRLRSCSISRPPAATAVCTWRAMSARSSPRWRASWLIASRKAFSASPGSGAISRAVSVATSSRACSVSCPGAITQRVQALLTSQPAAPESSSHISTKGAASGSIACTKAARGASSIVAATKPNAASTQAANITAGASTAPSWRTSTFTQAPGPAARAPAPPAPWWRTAWSRRRRRPARCPWPRRCRGPWR